MLCNSFHPPFLQNYPHKCRELHVAIFISLHGESQDGEVCGLLKTIVSLKHSNICSRTANGARDEAAFAQVGEVNLNSH
jgi:hypothetical protein